MSFKKVAAKIAKKGGYSKKAASALLPKVVGKLPNKQHCKLEQ